MRRTSSRRTEEHISGRPESAANLPFAPAPDAAPPSAPKDFTAQVMARLAAPPAPPDPRVARLRARRARARLAARVYVTLILVAGLGIALIAVFSPWMLATGVAGVVNGALYLVSAIAYAGRSTDGFINLPSALYALMLAALTPALFLLWRRTRRQRGGAGR